MIGLIGAVASVVNLFKVKSEKSDAAETVDVDPDYPTVEVKGM